MRRADRFWVFYAAMVRRCKTKLSRLLTARDGTNLEGKLLKANSQAGERLVTGTGLGHDGELGGRAVSVPGSYLEAIGVGRFEGSRGGNGGEATLLGRAHAAGPAGGLLRISGENRSRDHFRVSWRRQLIEPWAVVEEQLSTKKKCLVEPSPV